MDRQGSTQPDDRRDDDDVAAVAHTLMDPNRVHVTLENLIDLANLDTVGWSEALSVNGRDPAGSSAPIEPPLPRRQPSSPDPSAEQPTSPPAEAASAPLPFPSPPPFPGALPDELSPWAPEPALPEELSPWAPDAAVSDAALPEELSPWAPDAAVSDAAQAEEPSSWASEPAQVDEVSPWGAAKASSGSESALVGEVSSARAEAARAEELAFWGAADRQGDSGEVPAQPSPSLSPAAGPSASARARWARPAQRRLPESLALALASGAFVVPSVWILVIAVACVVAGSVAFVTSGNPLRTLPWRALRRGVGLLHPRSLSWGPVLTARVVLMGVLVPGAFAAALWLADEGRIGVLAAVRAGAWTHGFRVAGALVCFLLLTSVGDGRNRRAEQLRRLAGPLSDGALVLLVGSCLAVTLVAVAMPHPRDPVASGADGLGWLPSPARARADLVRDDIVTAELDTVASCLSKRGSTRWGTSYTSANGLDEPDVARLLVEGPDSSGPPYDLVTALMAAHNQLAPWVETIEVRLASDDVVRVDRSALASHRPLTDPGKLTSAATGLRQLAVGPADVTLALRCSAGPVL